ncbi:MAG: transposase [Actinomycetota bacterium]|nr:transposase [Actinomycetota bacterium]
MASRLYRTTQPLFLAIEAVLLRLGVAQLGSPTLVGLITLTVTGLVLFDGRPTQTRVATALPARAHDALNRLGRTMPFSSRAVARLLRAFVVTLGQEGYLSLDDVIVEKAFAKKLPWAAWTYSFAKKRKVYGLHIVLLVWCSDDGHWRIPVAWRIQRPKRATTSQAYKTRVEVAAALVREVLTDRLPVRYLVFDGGYTAGWFTKWLTGVGLNWQGTLDPRTVVVYGGVKQSVDQLAGSLPLKWRAPWRVRAVAVTVYAPTYGQVRLVLVKNRHGNREYLVSNVLTADLSSLLQAKRSRWPVETLFRDTKQAAGLEKCQCWSDGAWVRHVSLVMLSFVVLQLLRTTPHESVGAVKTRWQLQVWQNGELPPEPLRTCPPDLRVTA